MKRLSQFLAMLYRLGNRKVGRFPSFERVLAAASFVALLSLTFLAGAATMFFRGPTSAHLTEAFIGAQDYLTPDHASAGTPDFQHVAPPNLTLDEKGKAFDGFTLCLTRAGLKATLRDMQGNVVHHWQMEANRAWARAPHVHEPLPEQPVHWDNCRVCPDGSLLALCSRTPLPYGYALVKLDRDSNLLWAYSANVHHDFDVGDDGRIYVLTQHPDERPPSDLPGSPNRFYEEDLVILSPEGQPLSTISLYDAFHDSNFALLYNTQLWRNGSHFASADQSLKVPSMEGFVPGDVIHANSVKVLPASLAEHFPLFKPGWVLLSFRNSSIIALVDPEQRHVVWAAIGPWQAQHDAQFLPSGHLLLFDNLGSPNGARILEYDPVTGAIPWAYVSEEAPRPIVMPFRGVCQRLPNGNTLIVDVEQKVFEVTRSKESVWELSVPGVLVARRYPPDQVPFLTSKSRPE